jgi:superfamily I DNA and RNA helicase
MLELTIGEKTNTLAVQHLIEIFGDVNWNGSLYFGYPLLASVDMPLLVDALLTCEEHGIVVFHFTDRSVLDDDLETLRNQQDELYNTVDIKLRSNKHLLEGRKLPFDIHVVSVIPGLEKTIEDGTLLATGEEQLKSVIETFDPIENDTLRNINASIQRVTTIKPSRKRTSVIRTDSKGALLKEIEGGIANLDQWQKKGAIEFPEGVQRIRGLAGSGKTIVLALKAAYLHTAHPEWDIAITFHTRSLSHQIKELIRRFTFEHTNDEPDWQKLHVIHTWGSTQEAGIYSEIAQKHNLAPKNFIYGKEKFSYEKAFEGVCSELLNEIGTDNFSPLFDAVLIDEAQDLPQSFFELVFLATRVPKRIVYAYDELQNLSDYSMTPPGVLFGKDNDGYPRVPDLMNVDGNPKQDIVLPVCYRNTPWALSTAHALGFGIYRTGGLVQFFDNPSLLREIGYEIVSGSLALGEEVTLRRKKDSSPSYFAHLEVNDAIQFNTYTSKDAQAEALAQSINRDLADEELEHRDILVIISDPLTTRAEAGRLVAQLGKLGIPSHLAGVTSSRDKLFLDNSIAIANIYRAKGNEASMVYVINGDYSYDGFELEKRRNILFTAITRSKAWVRVFGCGERMDGLKREFEKVVKNDFEFNFVLPTADELQNMRRIHRDRTPGERKELQQGLQSMEKILSMLEAGDIALESLPNDLRENLEQLFGGKDKND